ncbi:hypothetical protein DNX69_10055 [Rhodopseudomonas palustris]|uniref:Uncharacterized protein n=1 Tax=Rhodopseudomonas palustris TaxID=1076 RepID=A0A323UIH0_RHOPL|nr:hypothetical protein [Rhodopseudomonas palustris]PZA12324.1 hypothetical protein DNX69_10055 [Rhodopseudomonas palustris]
MARNPEDPYRPDAPTDDPRSPSQLDAHLQADPEMREGPVTSGRLILVALAIVLAFAAVFYGMNSTATGPNNPSVATQTAPPPNQTDANNNAPPVPPGVRDVTPHNTDSNRNGVTTGAAPAPRAAPSSGSQN